MYAHVECFKQGHFGKYAHGSIWAKRRTTVLLPLIHILTVYSLLLELILFTNTRRCASPFVAQIQHFKHLCLVDYVWRLNAKYKVKSRQNLCLSAYNRKATCSSYSGLSPNSGNFCINDLGALLVNHKIKCTHNQNNNSAHINCKSECKNKMRFLFLSNKL